jgi:hypothetical protein
MFSAKIADLSDSLVVTFARENGIPVLGGLTPSQFIEFKDNLLVDDKYAQSYDAFAVVSDYMDSLCLKRLYNFCLKAKFEYF